jgi:exodeoxyribonuclease V alpha subunit
VATLEFTIKTIKKRFDIYAEVIGTNLKCSNSIWQKEARKNMLIVGNFPIGLDCGDKFVGEVTKQIDTKTATPYFKLDDSKEVKRVGLDSADSLSKFIQNKINKAHKENEKLAKWKITKKTCDMIIQLLGMDAVNIIIENPVKLLLYDELKLNDDKVFEMQSILSKTDNISQTIIALKSMQIPSTTIFELYEKYGERTLEILKDNPYKICFDENVPFSIADRIAYNYSFNVANPTRVKMAIVDFLRYKRNCGNICIYRSQIFKPKVENHETLTKYLNRTSSYRCNDDIPTNIIEEQLEILINEKKIIQEHINNHDFLYLPEMNKLEEMLISKVYEKLTNFNTPFCLEEDVDKFLDYYEETYKISLDKKQKEAVVNTLTNNMSILTGGPGTGKTATVAAIVAAIKYISINILHKEPSFQLAAPTGKAAERMTELTNEPASTIHRLLNISFHSTNETMVESDFIIVDEGSMIDLQLMNTLLNSLSERTRLLIVGDFNQLPSVGPGKILNDFLDSNVIPSIKLTRIFRQAQTSLIVENANKIIKGKTSDMDDGIVLTGDADRDFKYIESLTFETIKKDMTDKIDEYLEKGVSIKAIQILTPKRVGELGTDVLNTILQDKYNPNEVEYEDTELHLQFKVGDKVIQTSNNYNLHVFNGYIGEITEISSSNVNGVMLPSITVSYDNNDEDVVYAAADIPQLSLAYALTVHKSQGSEYPYVLMPIHREQNIMLNRNLFYTAVTRAKKEFVSIGEEESINYAIATAMSKYERVSNVCSKLKEKLGKE